MPLTGAGLKAEIESELASAPGFTPGNEFSLLSNIAEVIGTAVVEHIIIGTTNFVLGGSPHTHIILGLDGDVLKNDILTQMSSHGFTISGTYARVQDLADAIGNGVVTYITGLPAATTSSSGASHTHNLANFVGSELKAIIDGILIGLGFIFAGAYSYIDEFTTAISEAICTYIQTNALLSSHFSVHTIS